MTKQAQHTAPARARYVGVGEDAPAAANDLPAGVAVLTAPQLAQIVSSAMSDALAAYAPSHERGLLDLAGLCRALTCSPSLVRKLRQQGMPTLMLGDSPRFELDEVVAWLKAQHAPEAR